VSNKILIAARAWSVLFGVLAILQTLLSRPDYSVAVGMLLIAAAPWALLWIIRGKL
jgi:hypothetical protein